MHKRKQSVSRSQRAGEKAKKGGGKNPTASLFCRKFGLFCGLAALGAELEGGLGGVAALTGVPLGAGRAALGAEFALAGGAALASPPLVLLGHFCVGCGNAVVEGLQLAADIRSCGFKSRSCALIFALLLELVQLIVYECGRRS